MQVNTLGASLLTPGKTWLALPFLNAAAAPSSQIEALRTRRERAADLEKRRDDRKRDEDHAAALAHPGAAHEAWRAEREMRPGSAAARREQLEKSERGDVRDRSDFQSALQQSRPPSNTSDQNPDASPRSRRPDSPIPSTPAEPALPENAADRPAAEPVTPQRMAPAFSATASPKPRTNPAAPGALSVAQAPKIVAGPSAKQSALPAAPSVSPVTAPRPTAPAAVQPTGQSAPAARPRASLAAKPAAAPRNNDANFERILRFIQLSGGKQRSQAILRLEPPDLGKIRLEMHLRHDALALRIEPQSEVARKLLSDPTYADALRNGLEAAGIRLVRYEVQPAPDTPPDSQAHYDGRHSTDAHHGHRDHAQHQSAFSGGSAASGVMDGAATEPLAMTPSIATRSQSDALDIFA